MLGHRWLPIVVARGVLRSFIFSHRRTDHPWRCGTLFFPLFSQGDGSLADVTLARWIPGARCPPLEVGTDLFVGSNLSVVLVTPIVVVSFLLCIVVSHLCCLLCIVMADGRLLHYFLWPWLRWQKAQEIVGT